MTRLEIICLVSKHSPVKVTGDKLKTSWGEISLTFTGKHVTRIDVARRDPENCGKAQAACIDDLSHIGVLCTVDDAIVLDDLYYYSY